MKYIGKLQVPFTAQKLAKQCLSQSIEILPLQPYYIDMLSELPKKHNDPFDRIIIAQAQTEHMVIITKDSKIKLDDVPALW